MDAVATYLAAPLKSVVQKSLRSARRAIASRQRNARSIFSQHNATYVDLTPAGIETARVFKFETRCITLSSPEFEDRRTSFADHAQQHGWKFQWSVAIDARALPLDQYPDWISPKGTRPDWPAPLSPGEVGCAASHRSLYQHAQKENLDFLLVFEDDARIIKPPRFWIPHDADFVFINNRWLHNVDFEVWGKSCGLEGYVITRSGVAKMLELTRYVDLPIDLLVIAHCRSMQRCRHNLVRFRQQNRPQLKCYHIETLCEHDDSFVSSIRGRQPNTILPRRVVPDFRRLFSRY